MSKRVLITGASGLSGRALVAEFSKQSWDVLGLAYSRAGGALKKVDLRDSEAVNNILKEYKPSVVVHAAVERSPDVVENQEIEARKINVTATETIAKTCADIGAFLIFISTGYVFDGTKPPYKPGDTTCPLNKYGVSKVDGENLVRAIQTSSAILRVPILYGQVEFLKESSVAVLVGPLQDTSKQSKINDWQIVYPTHTNDVAAVCRQMADKYLQDSTFKGVFHWCSTNTSMTKYAMVTTMADVFGLPHDHIIADKDPPSGAPRPYDCTFDVSALEAVGIGQRTPFKEAIREMLEPYIKK